MEQKKKKKKDINRLPNTYVAAGIAIVSIMTILGISAFLRVNNIVVEGIVIYSAEQVADASGISKGNNLIYINRSSVESRIINELPYISKVSIIRKFPDTVVFEIIESKAVAYIPFAGDALIIDSSGRVLDIISLAGSGPLEIGGMRPLEIRGIPIIEASRGGSPSIGQGSETSFQTMKDILAAFERETIEREIDYLDVANITNISFGYADMYRVIIGGMRDYQRKISSLQRIVSQMQQDYPNQRGTLNLTDPLGDWKFLPDNY